MPQGFQCWDSAGNIVFDLSSRTGRIMGSVVVDANNSTMQLPLDTSKGIPFIIVPSTPAVNYQYGTMIPGIHITVSPTGQLNWAFPFVQNIPPTTVFYGLY